MKLLDATEQERLMQEFRLYIEQLNVEEESTGNARTPSPPVDLRTLLGELAVLKNEVRLESRQFKSTLEELRRMAEIVRQENERLHADVDRARAQGAASQKQAVRELLRELLDVRDRLQAGVDAGASIRVSPWAARLVPGQSRIARSLLQGTALTLRRLDDLLSAYRVRPVAALGKALDPMTMRVVAVESRHDAAEGSVLREIRRGFTQGDELLRAAEVVVNKEAKPT